MGTRRVRFADRRKFRRHATLPSRAVARRNGRRFARSAVRRRLGMDPQRVSPLPRLSRRPWSARRIQRQVHVQSNGPARRLVCHFPQSYPRDLPQFLPAGQTLAIQRHPPRSRSFMSGAPGMVTVLDLEPVNEDFLAEVLAGLSASPRSLPCKFFYDERGFELFQKICELPEYYITRTETELLRRHGREMAESI